MGHWNQSTSTRRISLIVLGIRMGRRRGVLTFQGVFGSLVELLEGLLPDTDPVHALLLSAETSLRVLAFFLLLSLLVVRPDKMRASGRKWIWGWHNSVSKPTTTFNGADQSPLGGRRRAPQHDSKRCCNVHTALCCQLVEQLTPRRTCYVSL